MSSTDRQLQENGRTVTRSHWLVVPFNNFISQANLKADDLSVIAPWTSNVQFIIGDIYVYNVYIPVLSVGDTDRGDH